MYSNFLAAVIFLFIIYVPANAEFRINTYTTEAQRTPAIASDNNGNSVIVWESYSQDGDSGGIYGQRLDKYGRRIGDEFPINQITSSYQKMPDIAMKSDGTFVVVWAGNDGSYEGIFARIYDSDAAPISNEFQVNSYTDSRQINPSVSMNESGKFVIVWQSEIEHQWHIRGQIYNYANNIFGNEFQVSQESYCQNPDISVERSGDFAIVWGGGYSPFFKVSMRRYYSNGLPKNDVLDMAGDTSSAQKPKIAINDLGQYILVWHNHPSDWQLSDVYIRIYDAELNPVTNALIANTIQDGLQSASQICVLPNGNFLVCWIWNTADGVISDGSGFGVYGQLFDIDGQKIGGQFQINDEFTSGDQKAEVVAGLPLGRFIVAWQSYGEDGSKESICASIIPQTRAGDFDGNDIVDLADLCLMAGSWLSDEPVFDISPASGGDNNINLNDLAIFAQQWN